MRRMTTAFLLLGMLVLAAASAEEIRAGRPERLGMASDRLARIDALMEREIDAGRLAGSVCVVARHGKIAYYRAFGKQDLLSDTPAAKDTMFRIYSMTKPITSVALMLLYEEGRFRLSDPVAWYLPEFDHAVVALEDPQGAAASAAFKTVPVNRPIIIRDLLRHTSGISYWPPANTTLAKMYKEADLFNPNRTLEAMVKRLSELPLLYQPGTRFEYGFSVDVVGRLIEVLAGMPYERFVKERVLDPLGMKDTVFWAPEEKAARLAGLYRAREGGKIGPLNSDEELAWDFTKPRAMPSPGGGLVSTAGDYLHFAQMLLSGGALGNVRLLSPKTVELMTQNHLVDGITKSWDAPAGFGLGFGIERDPGAAGVIGSEGTFGWSGAASTRCWIDPKEDMVAILMVQIFGDCPLEELFKIAVYQAIVK